MFSEPKPLIGCVLALSLWATACGGSVDQATADSADSAPTQTEPEQAAPEQTAPEQTAPEQAAPEQTATEQAAPDDNEAASQTTDPAVADTVAAVPIVLPSAQTIDLNTGQTQELAELGVSGPTLVWFWAPH